MEVNQRFRIEISEETGDLCLLNEVCETFNEIHNPIVLFHDTLCHLDGFHKNFSNIYQEKVCGEIVAVVREQYINNHLLHLSVFKNHNRGERDGEIHTFIIDSIIDDLEYYQKSGLLSSELDGGIPYFARPSKKCINECFSLFRSVCDDFINTYKERYNEISKGFSKNDSTDVKSYNPTKFKDIVIWAMVNIDKHLPYRSWVRDEIVKFVDACEWIFDNLNEIRNLGYSNINIHVKYGVNFKVIISFFDGFEYKTLKQLRHEI